MLLAWRTKNVVVNYLIVCIVGYVVIYGVAKAFPGYFSNVFFASNDPLFPLTFQMGMWLPFFVGIEELLRRLESYRQTVGYHQSSYLPRDESVILSSRDLGFILKETANLALIDSAITPRIIRQVILKFQASKSVDQASQMLTAQVDLNTGKMDHAYSRVKYLAWLMPTLGFLGTVYGISGAVVVIGTRDPTDPQLLKDIAANLAVAFDTTMLALVQSALVLWFMNIIEGREESLLNRINEYILENLINRLAP